jgi:Vault protein inter-alpha-trypsin domain
MRASAFALLSVCLTTSLLTACTAPATSAGHATTPSIKGYVRGIQDEAHAIELVTRSLDVDVAVRGAVAETEMTFLVAAPSGTSAPIEGRLHIDLPTGAIVTGYALDVNGGLVDGSLVDQSKARAAYEQQVRKQADPGLTAVDQAGGFNTRIFPIDAEHGRRVRVRFVAPISGDYRLPLALPAKAQLSVRVTQPGVRNPPVASLEGVRIRSSAGFAEGTAMGPVSGTLRIQPPPAREALASRHSSGEEYWQLSGTLPTSVATSGGGVLRVYWDRSRSRRDSNHDAELARVREAISALRPASIEWVDFSSGKPNRSAISSDRDLGDRVHNLRYGGATDFGSLSAEQASATCLFVSDGRSTFGPTTPPRLPCRLFAIASTSANVAVLQQMADRSGGRLVSGPTQAMDWTQPTVSAVRANGAIIEFVSLPAPTGSWRVAIPAPKTNKVTVDVAGDQVTRYGETSATRFNGEAELIAASRLAILGDTSDRKQFVDLSRRYSVASPTLSFVVLEKPEDYVQYEVTPPANYTRRDEWKQLAAEAAEDKAAAGKKRFDELLKDWQAQVAWWDKKFDITAKPKRPDEKPQQPSSMAAMAPPPPPPPPPPPAPLSGERDAVATGPAAPAQRVAAGAVSGTRAPNDVQIAVSAWRPDRDYLDAFDADPAAFDRVFAEWDKKSGDVPSFYLDTADWLYRKGRTDLAIETLLSALDLPVANEVTLGMVASRLERYGAVDEAIALRERHAALDADHPQPQRLLALALAKRASLGKPTGAADIARAIRLLADVALSPLDPRWRGIDMVALVEANALLPKLKALGGSFELDPRLTNNLQSDVRVVLDWSNDAADIDLWVDEPNGERAIYNYPRTLVGGHLSDDMTSGFGPEEYFLRRAATGRYTVRANVFSPDRLDPNGMSRVTAHLFRDWGRPAQREESIDLDLQRGQHGEVRIGTLKVGGEE